MKKTIFILLIFLFLLSLTYSSSAKEIILAKFSKKGYTAEELQEILRRYKNTFKKKRNKQYYTNRERKHFILPISGKITNDGFYKGVFIKSNYKVTKVKASKSGKVIYAGFLKYFGKIVIIKHKNGYITVYAYLKKLYTKKGEFIYQGEYIGEKYRTKPIYFEVRKKIYPINIIKYYSKLFHGRKINRIN